MLSVKQIKATIVQRIIVADSSCNSHHLNCVEAQLRALVYVLGEGDRPPVFRGDVESVCEAAGIPIEDNGDGTVGWPEAWLREHGFEIDGDDTSHPTLGIGW